LLEERCRVSELDSSSRSDELQQLTAVKRELEAQLAQLTDHCNSLTNDKTQVQHSPYPTV